MKTSILSALLLIATSTCYGQMPMFDQSRISESEPLEKNILGLIGENENSVLLGVYPPLLKKIDAPSVVKMNRTKLDDLSKVKIYPTNKNLNPKQVGFLSFRESVYMYGVELEKKVEKIVIEQLTNDLKPSGKTIESKSRSKVSKSEALTAPYQVSSELNNFFALVGKTRKEYLTPYQSQLKTDDSKKRTVVIALFDKDLNNKYFNLFELNQSLNSSSIIDEYVDNQGNVYLFVEDTPKYKNKERKSKHYIYQIKPDGTIISKEIDLEVDRLKFSFLKVKSGIIFINGIYDDSDLKDGYIGTKGIINISFVFENMENTKKINKNALGLEYLTAGMSDTEKEIVGKDIKKGKEVRMFYGFKNLSVKYLPNDSKLYLIERTSSQSSPSSPNSSQSYTTYRTHEILAIKVDNQGNTVWKTMIPKEQATLNSPSFHSFSSYLGSTSVYILFNSHTSCLNTEKTYEKNEITPFNAGTLNGFIEMVELNIETGIFERKRFINNQRRLVPSSSKQIDNSCYFMSKNKDTDPTKYLIKFEIE
jgi:hypothetical protein